MRKIEAIIKPFKLDDVREVLGELGVAGVYGALWGGFGIIAFFRGRREARIARPYDTRHPIVKRGINMMLLITGAMCSVSAFLAFSSAG